MPSRAAISNHALQPATPPPGPVPLGPRVPVAAEMVRNGDIDGALALFVDGIDGEGAWARWPAAPRQQLRDNIHTLLGQVGENRKPFLKSEAKSIKTPTLLIGGGDTKGALAVIWRVLAEHIPGAKDGDHPGHAPLDVRTGAAGILRRGAGFSEGVNAPARLLLIEAPRAIPIGGRRVGLKILDTLGHRHRRSVAGDRLERSLEGPARVIPAARPIGGKPFGISRQQFKLLLAQARPCAR